MVWLKECRPNGLGLTFFWWLGLKGFLACPAIDVDACDGYGVAAAIVESTPENPIGTLERFPNRKITKTNAKAKALGIKEGMDVTDAFAFIS